MVEGRVTKVVTFGAFVEILDGVEGLVHISELAQHHVENPREVIQPGDPVNVKILEIDAERRRLSLSIKRVEGQVLPVRPIVAPAADEIEDVPELGLSEDVFAESDRRGRGRGSRDRWPRSELRTRSSSRPRRRRPTSPRTSPPLWLRTSPPLWPRTSPPLWPRTSPSRCGRAGEPTPSRGRGRTRRRGRRRACLVAGAQAEFGEGRYGLHAPPFIALTGGIGAGKSTALAALERLGAAVISSDAVVHELYARAAGARQCG